jgi:peptide/nickel transport system substrate-binding protein
MTTRTHESGYPAAAPCESTTTLRKSLRVARPESMFSELEYDEKIRLLHLERDEAKRIEMVREMTAEILDQAPYIWLPIAYVYTAWWPWVKNYGGELRAGAVRPAPIYARIWIDRDMKRRMGFE